jgi:hypothetical protein
VAPNNRAVMIMGDAGGDPDVSNLRLTFQTGGGVLPDDTQLFSGVFAPANYADTLGGNDIFPNASGGLPNPPAAPAGGYSTDLATLDGIDPNGQWRLYVRDDTTGESGEILRGWILILETGPTVSNPGQQVGTEDTRLDIPFTVADEDSTANQLTVTVAIDDTSTGMAPDLIASSNLVKNGFSYTLQLQPSTNRPAGTAPETNRVTLTVTDERGEASSSSFLVIFNPVDDPPTISASASTLTINEDSATTITLTVTDVDSTLRTNDLTIASSNTALVPNTAPNITLSSPATFPPGAAGTITVNVTPVADQNGTTVLTFTIRDRNGGGSSASTNVTLNVTPVNDLPFIGPLDGDDSLSMQAGSTRTINFVVTDKFNETRAENITVTAVSSDDTVIPDSNVIVGGSGTNRTLTLTALNTTGNTTITVTATDDNTPVPGVTTRNLTVTVTPSPTSVFANLAPITIRDTNTASPYPSTINIPSVVGVVRGRGSFNQSRAGRTATCRSG